MTMLQAYEAHEFINSLTYCEALRVLNYLGVILRGKKDYQHCVQTKPMIFSGGHIRLMEL